MLSSSVYECSLPPYPRNAFAVGVPKPSTFAKVEDILYSRPIASVSDDPSDGAGSSSAQFLIGSHLLSASGASLHNPAEEDSKLRYLTRWQRLTFMKQHFWRSWRRDYIHSLQDRGKWTSRKLISRSANL